ncbi:MAG: glycerophosphodiester phosphodiesterase family protein [Candidatus Komeilibacteria bacterium]|nr:glycerophosphodiester phosphodiesterase family protein [Candidatus Komeilibacteria bacterium]
MLVIGHRGAAGYEPENTLRSFKKALKLGVDMVELDVYLCASGELVVIHDKKVDRTTSGRGLVEEKTLKELKRLKIARGQKIPTLNQVLNLLDGKIKVNFELKGKNTAAPLAELIAKYIKIKGWSYNNFLVSSFKRKELARFAALAPKVPLGLLVSRLHRKLPKYSKKFNFWSVHLAASRADKKLINQAHCRGFKVFIWTVDKPAEIKKFKALGVDGIFTNFPDRA